MKKTILLLSLVAILASCREDTGSPYFGNVPPAINVGFYLLNEGNMGSNKASLDYYDYDTEVYTRNIYAAINPNVIDELGDVGNDIGIYGGKMYVVVNCSNIVEVLEARTAKHISFIEIPNCRYVVFDGGKAYVSSYAGAVHGDTNKQRGYVAEIDTTTLQITRTVKVGHQPEEMAVIGRNLYVANSGGYTPPDYDSTVSVINLDTFQEEKKITVGINLHCLQKDNYGDLYITSRGDYYYESSKIYVLDTQTEQVKKTFDVAGSSLCIAGDTVYSVGYEFSYLTGQSIIDYNRIDVNTENLLGSYITDGTNELISTPYAVAVNPITREIFVTDAKNYAIPGSLYCFNQNGILKWTQVTGDIPAHLAFLNY